MKQNNQIRNSRSRKIGVGVGFALATIAVGSAIAVPNIIAYQNRPVSSNNVEWSSGPNNMGAGFYSDFITMDDLNKSFEITAVGTADHSIQYISLYNCGTEDNPIVPIHVGADVEIKVNDEILELGRGYNIYPDDDGNPYIQLVTKVSDSDKINIKFQNIDSTKVSEGDRVIARLWNDEATPVEAGDLYWYDNSPYEKIEGNGWFTTSDNYVFFTSEEKTRTLTFVADGQAGHTFDHAALYDLSGKIVSADMSLNVGDRATYITTPESDGSRSFSKITTTDFVSISVKCPDDQRLNEKFVLRLYSKTVDPTGVTALNLFTRDKTGVHSITNKLGYLTPKEAPTNMVEDETYTFECKVSAKNDIKYFGLYSNDGKLLSEENDSYDIEITMGDGSTLVSTNGLTKKSDSTGLYYKVWDGNSFVNQTILIKITYTGKGKDNVFVRAWNDEDANTICWRKLTSETDSSYYSDAITIPEEYSYKCYVSETGQPVNRIRLVDPDGKPASTPVGDVKLNTIYIGDSKENDFNNWTYDSGQGAYIRNSAIEPNEIITLSNSTDYIDTPINGVAWQLDYYEEEPETHDIYYSSEGIGESGAGYMNNDVWITKNPETSIYFKANIGENSDIQSVKLINKQGKSIDGETYKVAAKIKLDGKWVNDDPDNWSMVGNICSRKTPLPWWTEVIIEIKQGKNIPEDFTLCAFGKAETKDASFTEEYETPGYYSQEIKDWPTTGLNVSSAIDARSIPDRFGMLNDQKELMYTKNYTLNDVYIVSNDGSTVRKDTTNWSPATGEDEQYYTRKSETPIGEGERVIFCVSVVSEGVTATASAWNSEHAPVMLEWNDTNQDYESNSQTWESKSRVFKVNYEAEKFGTTQCNVALIFNGNAGFSEDNIKIKWNGTEIPKEAYSYSSGRIIIQYFPAQTSNVLSFTVTVNEPASGYISFQKLN